MRKLIVGLLASTALFVGFGVSTAQAVETTSQTVASQAVASKAVSGKITVSLDGSVKSYINGKLAPASIATTNYWYNGRSFVSRVMCADNRIGLYWNQPQAIDSFESGLNTVIVENHNVAYGDSTCYAHGYSEINIIRYWVYNSADGGCSNIQYQLGPNGHYDAAVNVYMNQHYASCIDTLQHRNNQISNASGVTFGLAQFSSSTNLTGAVMNQYFRNSYNFAGADDRNALYALYN